MNKRGRPKGFTLAELLSYTFLSALVLGIMGLFFFSVLKQYAYISESATLRKLGSLIIRQLKNDLEEATAGSVTTGDAGLIIQPINSIDPPAETTWSDDIICYQHQSSERKLLRWVQGSLGSTPGPGLQSFTEADIQGLRPPDSQILRWNLRRLPTSKRNDQAAVNKHQHSENVGTVPGHYQKRKPL